MKTETSDLIELILPRRAEFVHIARTAGFSLACQLEFTLDVAEDIKLALGEACTNAVEHVCDENCNTFIVRYIVEKDRLIMEVIDHGQGFDPKQESGCHASDDDDAPLGLIIIRALMDEVIIDCNPETGTCVRMIKMRPGWEK